MDRLSELKAQKADIEAQIKAEKKRIEGVKIYSRIFSLIPNKEHEGYHININRRYKNSNGSLIKAIKITDAGNYIDIKNYMDILIDDAIKFRDKIDESMKKGDLK